MDKIGVHKKGMVWQMEQDFSKNTFVLQEKEEIGSVKIADDVVAMIAALAATEVEGVAAMSNNMTNEF